MIIKLSNCEFKIDYELWEKLKEHKWYYDASTGYVHTRINNKKLYLHRMVLSAKKGDIVDHINRNKLDNSVENLRIVSKSLNNHNRNYKGAHGIYFDKWGNRWRACIAINHRTIKLGSFKSKEMAMMEYNKKATEKYGDSAVLNTFPDN